ncbi:uncharacterized protein LOC107197179 [Astyanax mexicanus]|uniref:uncharacterized protein LOC107197179 n=1 Tax=Astyanax mexicanus TaxID=7994 RepID=UPI0020CB2654|nr:uncharacterized protein LOC107197179 [Astyanax mexicanus]
MDILPKRREQILQSVFNLISTVVDGSQEHSRDTFLEIVQCINELFQNFPKHAYNNSNLTNEDRKYVEIKLQQIDITKNQNQFGFAVIIDINNDTVEYTEFVKPKEKEGNIDRHTQETKYHCEEIIIQQIKEKIKNRYGLKIIIFTYYSPCLFKKGGVSCMSMLTTAADDWKPHNISTTVIFKEYYHLQHSITRFISSLNAGNLKAISSCSDYRAYETEVSIQHLPKVEEVLFVLVKKILNLDRILPVQKPLKIEWIKNRGTLMKKIDSPVKKFFITCLDKDLQNLQMFPQTLNEYYNLIQPFHELKGFWVMICDAMYTKHCKDIFIQYYNKAIFNIYKSNALHEKSLLISCLQNVDDHF